MTIAFFGHGDFIKNKDVERKLTACLKDQVGDRDATLLCGGYGGFDAFVLECGKQYRKMHRNTRIIFVTPYLPNEQKGRELMKQEYDEILYPGLENRPQRYAIIFRNRFMVEQADLVIVYLEHTWGGAYQAYEYAKRKGKVIINLALSRIV